NQIRINAGEINNSGVELFLNAALVASNPFRWEMTFTAARQWDEIIQLYPGITQKNENAGNLIRRKAEGERMNTLWIQDYAENEINVGTTNTDVYGGLSTNFYLQGDWGMLNLMGALDYKYGGSILSYSNFYLKGNGLTTETLPGRPGHGGLTWTETLSDGST